MTRILYLHGFASSPSSSKAVYFRDLLAAAGASVEILDLAAGDFEHLTISSQFAVLQNAARGEPVALMGSSMGGYLAALYAACHPEVSRLVLLAPAFRFAQRWRERLGSRQLEAWQQAGTADVYHYGDKRNRQLAFDLMLDSELHAAFPDFHQPALIFHGDRDDVVPPQYSEQFATKHPNAKLEIVDSGHDLLNQLTHIGPKVVDFLLG
jgi:pimeloyl-ACP methyl ester carboxylesterase